MFREIVDSITGSAATAGGAAHHRAGLNAANDDEDAAQKPVGEGVDPWPNAIHGRRVTVHAPPDSSDTLEAQALMRDADRLIDELYALISPGDETSSVDPVIRLSTPRSQGFPNRAPFANGVEANRASPPNSDEIVISNEGEIAGQLSERVTRWYVGHWFGHEAGRAPILVEGVAGIAAARAHLGPSPREADRWVQTEINAGRSVSLFAHASTNGSAPVSSARRSEEPAAWNPAAISFVAYLVAAFGAGSLRTYFQTYNPARQDTAARNAYQRPLGVLEEQWLNALQRNSGAVDAFRALLPRLLPMLKPYRRQMADILVFLVVIAACNVGTPLAVKYFLKDFQYLFRHGQPTLAQAVRYCDSTLLGFIALLGGIYLLSGLASLSRAQSVNWLNQTVLNGLQVELFAHLQRLPHSFYARARVGDLMLRLTEDMDSVQSALSQLTNKSLYQVFMLVGGAIGLFLTTGLSPVTLMILLILPLFGLAYAALRTRNKAASREQRKQAAQTAAMEQEMLSAQSLTKAFGLEERVTAAFRDRVEAQKRSRIRLARLGALTDLSEDVATQLAQLVIFGVGGFMVLVHPKAGIRIEDMVASLLLVKYIVGPVASLSGIGQTLQQASGAIERVNDLFDEPITVADKPGARELPPLSGAIAVEHVTFGFGDGRNILQDLSLTIPAGAHVAIVGRTGCGKSTTLHLLMRYYDPQDGRILFDGHDLREVTLASLRGRIGFVAQDTFVFNTTVRENIAVGLPDATDARIAEAAQAAHLERDIQAMPNGFDTVLGERGVRISGGQRQRLALARAILRSPRILLLDEATSELDAQTEADILQTLAARKDGCTVVSVTHRMSLAMSADHILVMDAGRVVEQGSHDELVSAGGYYQRLFAEQMGSSPGNHN